MSLNVERLYTQEHDRLCAYFRKRLPDHDTAVADDLAQEVFLRIWRKQHTYHPRPGISEGVWMMTIARHVFIDYIRHEAAVQRLVDRLVFESHPAAPSQVSVDERTELLNNALALLPEQQRKAIEARYYLGIKDRELVGVTTVNGAKKLRWRALARLRKALEGAA